MGKSSASKDIDLFGASISIKLPNGQVSPITLHKYDQMSKVYDKASVETGAKESLIRIKYSGKVLKKTQTASYLGLMSGMVLKAEVSGVLFLYNLCD